MVCRQEAWVISTLFIYHFFFLCWLDVVFILWSRVIWSRFYSLKYRNWLGKCCRKEEA
jgi:hypothetical protein